MYVWLDYFGPLYIKENKEPRVCLFTCVTTRAVHLEVVQDVSANAFPLYLRRFIATWGNPNEITKQNNLNYPVKPLNWYGQKMLQDEDVQNYTAKKGTKLTFIIELAPWIGGFYERLVGV